MSTPDERKTMQVSPSVHTAVHDLATRLGTSADGALRHLLQPYTVRVRLESGQYARWSRYAEGAGVTLSTWVLLQTEASLRTAPDRKTLEQIFHRVDLLCQAAGLKNLPMDPPRKENH